MIVAASCIVAVPVGDPRNQAGAATTTVGGRAGRADGAGL